MILIDADACPVKSEITEVALRRNMQAIFVAGSYLRLTNHPLIKLFVAGDKFDAADDAIAEVARPGTVTITADILRNLMHELRPGMEGMTGGQGGGQPPFGPRDRAAFKNALDRILTRMAKG